MSRIQQVVFAHIIVRLFKTLTQIDQSSPQCRIASQGKSRITFQPFGCLRHLWVGRILILRHVELLPCGFNLPIRAARGINHNLPLSVTELQLHASQPSGDGG